MNEPGKGIVFLRGWSPGCVEAAGSARAVRGRDGLEEGAAEMEARGFGHEREADLWTRGGCGLTRQEGRL